MKLSFKSIDISTSCARK